MRGALCASRAALRQLIRLQARDIGGDAERLLLVVDAVEDGADQLVLDPVGRGDQLLFPHRAGVAGIVPRDDDHGHDQGGEGEDEAKRADERGIAAADGAGLPAVSTTATYNPNDCLSFGQSAQLVTRFYKGPKSATLPDPNNVTYDRSRYSDTASLLLSLQTRCTILISSHVNH